MSRICVVGAGYVGLVTGACFAELGHRVTVLDIDQEKVIALTKGILPFYEPGLEPLVLANMKSRRLSFATSFPEAMQEADFVFMCVGTPVVYQKRVDLSYLHNAYMKAASALSGNPPLFVNKSTVPPGTADMMSNIMSARLNGHGPLKVAANPEFLREGHAVEDFLHPSRIVIGARSPEVAGAVADLYAGIGGSRMITDPVTAELVKYAGNAFLATKVSFINEIALLCEKLGVDVRDVSRGIGMDPRIGPDFLNAGIGYGGSCLPKDTAALTHFFDAYCDGARLLQATIEVNSRQPERLVRRIKAALGSLKGARVAVLGLTFKPDTDDLRCSPAVELVKGILLEGAEVRACDPLAWRRAAEIDDRVTGTNDPYQAAQGCDAVVLATDWEEYRVLDLNRLREVMRGNVLADGRNAFDPNLVREAGFMALSVGRPTHLPGPMRERQIPG
jgi:UDPglucose 6-dehydrogenase